MYCEECGGETPPNRDYCIHCETKIEPETSPSTQKTGKYKGGFGEIPKSLNWPTSWLLPVIVINYMIVIQATFLMLIVFSRYAFMALILFILAFLLVWASNGLMKRKSSKRLFQLITSVYLYYVAMEMPKIFYGFPDLTKTVLAIGFFQLCILYLHKPTVELFK